MRRQLDAALVDEGFEANRRSSFLQRFEGAYKAPFPPPDEETLAGGLSNTIAGRICNYYDLHGGGYTVDGACASSLLAVAHACRLLESNEVDTVPAGGVDLSLDPFELVGFARNGALSKSVMRVFDRQSDGFWPGEGCGFVVLKRVDAAAAGHGACLDPRSGHFVGRRRRVDPADHFGSTNGPRAGLSTRWVWTGQRPLV